MWEPAAGLVAPGVLLLAAASALALAFTAAALGGWLWRADAAAPRLALVAQPDGAYALATRPCPVKKMSGPDQNAVRWEEA
jgi:hypothetical protein